MIDSFQVLLDLSYCNHHFKEHKSDLISSTKFYQMKENLLHYIIEHREDLEVEVIPVSIQLKDLTSLFISLTFNYNNFYFKFHQLYRPSYYKEHLDLSKISFEEFDDSDKEDFPFELDKFNRNLRYLIDVYGKVITDQNDFLKKSKTILYKKLKEQYPNISFIRNKNWIKLEGTFEGKKVKGSYNRKRLLELFSEGKFNVVVENIYNKM